MIIVYFIILLSILLLSKSYLQFSKKKTLPTMSIKSFFNLKHFLVVGASIDRTKFGNKVLRCYQRHEKFAIPISKREKVIEGAECLDSITSYSNYPQKVDWSEVGVSIITSPGVTSMIMDEALNLGVNNFFLQPGTYDDSTLIDEKWKNVNVIKGCVLVELGCLDLH